LGDATLDDEVHREKTAPYMPTFPSCIARKVPRNEYSKNPKAKAAMDAEWNKLRTLKRPDLKDKRTGAWYEGGVREAAAVRAEARHATITTHFGRIVELCTEKGSELATNDPLRKMKGRAVFLGDNVRDENFNWAEFADLGSSPPTMEASKALDAMGSLEGYNVKTGDARGAYTQSYLRGCNTWVALPADRWPKEWIGKCKNPICNMHLLLYGHPDAGGYWEQDCENGSSPSDLRRSQKSGTVSTGTRRRRPCSSSTLTTSSWPRGLRTWTSCGKD
jgi:hypothetical protein